VCSEVVREKKEREKRERGKINNYKIWGISVQEGRKRERRGREEGGKRKINNFKIWGKLICSKRGGDPPRGVYPSIYDSKGGFSDHHWYTGDGVPLIATFYHYLIYKFE